MLYRAHYPVSLAIRGDVEFFEIIKLKIKEHDTRNVVPDKIVNHTRFKASISHPIGHLMWRPVPYLSFVKFGDSLVQGAERSSVWGLGSFWHIGLGHFLSLGVGTDERQEWEFVGVGRCGGRSLGSF